jgi:two-component system CheB/CheR fusion protein
MDHGESETGTPAGLLGREERIDRSLNRSIVHAQPSIDNRESEILAGDQIVRLGYLALRRILSFLRSRTGHDFSSYKRATIMRRIGRRMQVTRRPGLRDYSEFLIANPEEAQELFDDLLISVTSFFRDPAAYKALAEEAIGPMFEEADENGIRAWVVGCATGEEAYSLAILMLEEAARRRVSMPVQIFATDLDEGALATARQGRFPASIEADVSEERLTRWFVREGPHYRIKQEVRDIVLFASHSVLKDPPFMRLDLVSCRNLLIYLERELQRQVCTLFHYGLRPHGFLFLGSAETVEAAPDSFFAVNREARLYRARPMARGSVPILPNLPAERHPAMPETRGSKPLPKRRPVPQEDRSLGAAHVAALERTAPPSVMVDHDHNILHLSQAPDGSCFQLVVRSRRTSSRRSAPSCASTCPARCAARWSMASPR